MDRPGLRGEALRGLAWGIGGKGGLILSNLLVLMITSRLLTPVEFGVFATAAIFIDLSWALATSGFGIAIVQKRDLTAAELDASFTGFFLIGVSVAAGIAAAAFPLQRALAMPSLGPVLIAIAAALPFRFMANFYGACLQREMKLKEFQWSQNLPQILGGLGVTATTALLGFGVWALVFGFVVSVFIELLMTATATRLRARLSVSLAPLRNMMSVSAATVTNRLILSAGGSADRIVAASLLGAVSLGLYNRATTLVFVPTKLLGMPIDKVLLSTFAQLQEEQERISRALSRFIEIQTLFYMPAGVALALCAPMLIRVILGDQWDSAIPVAQILFLATFARLGFIPAEAAAVAVGKAWGATSRQAAFAVALIVGALVGSNWSIIGLAAGVATARILFYGLSLNFARTEFGIHSSHLALWHARAAIVSLAGVGAWLVVDRLPIGPSVQIAEQNLLPAIGYGAAVIAVLLAGPRWLIGEQFVLIRRSAVRLLSFRRS